MRPEFPIPKRAVLSCVMAGVSLLVSFGMILLCAHLTGYREMADFSGNDQRIFLVMMASSAVSMLIYTLFVFAAGRMFLMRSCLIRKRKERFASVQGSMIRQPCEDVWQDSRGGRRALSYRQGRLILLLTERYEQAVGAWKPEQMIFYDSVQEMERSLRCEHGFEWDEKPQTEEKDDQCTVRVSIEDSDI